MVVQATGPPEARIEVLAHPGSSMPNLQEGYFCAEALQPGSVVPP
jgi:hypothetical protein